MENDEMGWPSFWLKKDWRSWALLPLAGLVCWLANRRKQRFYQAAIRTSVPVLVVGNIVVGGTGKTPFIQWLGQQLSSRGLKFGVISRGYGGQAKTWPQQVSADSEPGLVGDEPVLLAQTLGCPIVVSPKRPEALAQLLETHPDLELVISDDGLQHYALSRDIELVLLDASRPNQGLGNGLCLPAGPLREPVSRLAEVDFVVFNGVLPSSLAFEAKTVGQMQLQPSYFYNLKQPQQRQPLDAFVGQIGYGMAAIGHPQRFYTTLNKLGVLVEPLDFADHHAYQMQDFAALNPAKPVFMTAKDAVKCQGFAQENWWVLVVEPHCSAEFSAALMNSIAQCIAAVKLKPDTVST